MLMEIVNSDPEFSKMFDYWTKPLNVVTTHLPITEYTARSPIKKSHYGELAVTLAKESVRRELAQTIDKHIEWSVVDRCGFNETIKGIIRIAEARSGIDETAY